MSDDVKNAVETALRQENFEYEIAFFGGSFTAIDREYMVSLLEPAYEYIKNYGQITGIRISTRPDCINEEILSVLKRYGVTSIELGAQSMNDDVLFKNMRGHTADDVRKASALIKENGFELGLQMMTGLYGTTPQIDVKTAEELIKLKPDTVRIYPTVVLSNTYLAVLYNEGKYAPFDVEKSVGICAELVPMFKENNIRVIRTGLHSSEVIKADMLAGGYHDAFGELVASRIMLNELLAKPKGRYTVYINEKSISKLIGNKKCNLIALEKMQYNIDIKTDNKIKPNELKIEDKLWF